MAHKLENLDEQTRRWMLEELQYDLEHGSLYVSPLLSERGRREYATILKEALKHHDPQWLASSLGSGDRFDLTQASRHATTRLTAARRTAEDPADPRLEEVPVDAPTTLAEGEFNRFHARGLCRRAMAEGLDELELYKIDEAVTANFVIRQMVGVKAPKGEPLTAGTRIDPRELLPELRKNPEDELDVGEPGAPNSGLAVRLPR